ncbi:hypothetical protein C7E12_21485, partial [Stenotrophomonas maltophilia]
GPPPAGFELQAVRLRGRFRQGLQPSLDRARRPGRVPRSPRQDLGPAERRRRPAASRVRASSRSSTRPLSTRATTQPRSCSTPR